MKSRERFLTFVLVVAFLVLAFVLCVVAFVHISQRSAVDVASVTSSLFVSQDTCPVQVGRVTVHGNSLSGFITPGQVVEALIGYYACHNPQRGDIVVYLYGNEPIIKIIKAVPGDIVSLKKAGGSWNIVVNGALLQTTVGIPYAINNEVFNMFSRYVAEVNGIIPPDIYMILGNLPAGSVDSTYFGFVRKQDLVGKIIL